jgi:hypothetical protein
MPWEIAEVAAHVRVEQAGRKRTRLALFAVFIVAGALSSLIHASMWPDHPAARGGEMVAIAENLVRHGQFGNPFSTRETGATAILAPVYPFLLATVLGLLEPAGSRLAVIILAALMHGFHAALLVQLSRALFKNQWPGIWAAGIATVFPTIRFMPAWEATSAATGLLTFCLLSHGWLRDGHVSVCRAALLGFMTGILVLLNPVAGLVAIIWALLLFRERWKDRPRSMIAIAGFALMLFITALPWAIRNQIVFGAPVIKNALGIALAESNNECASSNYLLNLQSGCSARHHPYYGQAEADLLVTMGEVKYDTYRLRTAVAWIRSNPGVFLRLTVRRTFEFWFPNPVEAPYAYSISIITLLSLPGFVLMARKEIVFLRFAIWASFVYPLTYYVVFSDSRYRIPILWISLLGAGYFLQAVWIRLIGWRKSQES